MNYELASALKDAGFPQREVVFGKPYIPTLEELIEACKESKQTGEFHLETIGDEWCVGIREADGSHHWLYRGIYKTPKEAVAHLYLALKQKTNE